MRNVHRVYFENVKYGYLHSRAISSRLLQQLWPVDLEAGKLAIF